ncbi:MAG TPA: PAS domain-containing protein, partial [Verrucomicrobiae bacterium]
MNALDIPPKTDRGTIELTMLWQAINRVQGIIEFDAKGNILRANDNFLKIMGYSEAELTGKHHRIFCEERYVRSADYTDFWTKLGAGELDAGEYKRFGKDGREVWIQASYNPIFDDAGKVAKIIKFATDITQTKAKDADFTGKVNAINRVQGVIE